MSAALFSVGKVLLSGKARNILRLLRVPPAHLIHRHVTGEWGLVDFNVETSNYSSIRAKHAPILSRYSYRLDSCVYYFDVSTNAEQTQTTIDLVVKKAANLVPEPPPAPARQQKP